MNDYLILDNKKYKILHYFKNNNDNYIIYSDDNEILSNKYVMKDNNISLLPINDDEWEIVDQEWEKLNG